jgi:hypothetical protein
MSKSHNKKRSTGLLYEFLVRSVSDAVVKGDTKRSSTALRVIRKHFKPGSELYKEFRLINSLFKTTVSSEAVAASIIQEAKAASRSHDVKLLDREKSLLISAINRSMKDDDFFERPVEGYRMLATIQTLVNDWRQPVSDLSRMAQYEDQLLKHLVVEKVEAPSAAVSSEDSPGTGRLLMRVMMKKLNEKYAGSLTAEQKQLLRAYAFSAANDDPASIKLKLQEIKEKLLAEIDSYGDNEYVGQKLAEARSQIESEPLESVDDETVTRFMLYTKLKSELTGEGK